MLSITEIKAELYTLQGHVCNGSFTVIPDGSHNPGDHGCDGCARTMKLQSMLREAAEVTGGK